jgi:hypothetical protein
MHDTHTLLRRGLLLEYITLSWNVVGAVVVIIAAFTAHSVALAGFGLDSLIEIGASTVVIWQLRGIHDQREQRALRLIAVAFFALAVYILGQSAQRSYSACIRAVLHSAFFGLHLLSQPCLHWPQASAPRAQHSTIKSSGPRRELLLWTPILLARFFSASCSTHFLDGGGQTRLPA